MTVIRTKTPSGEAIVIMPEAEFERLRELAEDAEDIAAGSRVQAALAAGEEELLTGEELDALREAPTPLAFWRDKRKIPLETLANRIGVAPDWLIKVESGASDGDIYLYQKAAEALRLNISDLIPARP